MLLAGGCHRHDAFFQSVEDLMVTAPDSALALVENFRPSGRAEKARRALLIAKAKNKAYIDIADDSLIETAVDYYRGHNDSLEVQALYYSACFRHFFCSKTLIADYQGYNCREFGNLGNAE